MRIAGRCRAVMKTFGSIMWDVYYDRGITPLLICLPQIVLLIGFCVHLNNMILTLIWLNDCKLSK